LELKLADAPTIEEGQDAAIGELLDPLPEPGQVRLAKGRRGFWAQAQGMRIGIVGQAKLGIGGQIDPAVSQRLGGDHA
jgi:hypothetical protein